MHTLNLKNFKLTYYKLSINNQVSFLSNHLSSTQYSLPIENKLYPFTEGVLKKGEVFNPLVIKREVKKEGKFIKKNSVIISRIGKLSKKVIIGKAKDRLSEYQSQFKAKQLIKKFYGNLSESDLINLTNKNKNNLPLICLIERRLDIVVFRLGFARSINEAKYLIKTKQIKVNNVIIKHSNFMVSNGSTIISSSLISYLSRLLYLKLNYIKLPSHLFYYTPIYSFKENNKWEGNLIGMFIKDPLESEIYLPYNFPLDKFNSFIHKY